MNYKYTDLWNKLEYTKANDLYETNPLLAKERFEKYLKNYPKDYVAYTSYASVLILLQDINGAEKIMKYVQNLVNKDEHFKRGNVKKEIFKENFLINSLRILSHKKEYAKLLKLVLSHQDNGALGLKQLELYAKKKLGILNENRVEHHYIYRQIIEYQESDFLYHIKKHLADYNQNLDDRNKVIFAPNFPLNDVLQEVKKYVPSENKLITGAYQETYCFKYDYCGRVNEKVVNYFKVIVFKDTCDFITIYPAVDCENLPHIDLNYLQKTSDYSKVKKLSQIDKFNRRFNR